MKKNSNSKGITLISLIITVIILLILASIATYSGIEIIESSKMTAFTAEMKIMQTYVNSLYDKWKRGEINKDEIGKSLAYNSEAKEQTSKVLVAALDIKDTSGYRYYDQETIKELNIEGVEQEFFINLEKREVVSYKGLKYRGNMYYTLMQLPDGLYNVDYNPREYNSPTFDVSYKKIAKNKYKITISNIQYEGYINKWTVRCKLEGKSYENVSEDLSYIVERQGIYDITIENGDIKSEIKKITINEPNAPEITEEMVPIKWENEDWVTCNQSDIDWYSYRETTDEDMTDGGTTNGGNSRWANVMLDGNYYVWIPRYAYKIDNTVTYTSLGGGTSKKIDIQFIENDITSTNIETEVGEGYIVHPAFKFGEKELTGIWVGKYETSGDTDNPTILPNKLSLRNINVSTMFNTAQKLSTDNYDTHMMKNIEWGAVAYLAQSKYGRNGTEISVNQCIDCYTGTGTGIGENKIYNSMYTWNNITDNQKYNGKIGKLSSTTGNIYGIYDMSGGSFEYVMGVYGTNGNPKIGSSGFTTYPEEKYYDLYTNANVDNTNIGDVLYETKGWNSDSAYFVNSDSPFFGRGGSYYDSYNAGAFYYGDFSGSSVSVNSFRVCLTVK